MSGGLRFDGKAVIITGGGGALGRAYGLMFAQRGASILVEDLNKENADKVVAELRGMGAQAVACYDGVLDGAKIVEACIQAFGGVHIVINNAGHIMDVSFGKMTSAQWESIHKVHLQGAFEVTRAAWPHFRNQKYGRVINTTSPAGLYGNFGQANYSSAKLGLHGLSMTLAREGAKYNICANTIAPLAASPMLATVMPPAMMKALSPDHVASLVVYLCHESCTETGAVFEAHGGWFAKLTWQRSPGLAIPVQEGDVIPPEKIRDEFSTIIDMSNPQGLSSLSDGAERDPHMAKLLANTKGKAKL